MQNKFSSFKAEEWDAAVATEIDDNTKGKNSGEQLVNLSTGQYTGLVELWSMYVVWERESMKNRTLQGEALLASQNGPFLLS